MIIVRKKVSSTKLLDALLQEGLNKKSHCYFFNIARPVESQVAPKNKPDKDV
jgi:hypothetical protein